MVHGDRQHIKNLGSIQCTETGIESLMRSVQSTHASPVLHIKPGHLNTLCEIHVLYMHVQI